MRERIERNLWRRPADDLTALRAKLASEDMQVRRDAMSAIYSLKSPDCELLPDLIRILKQDIDGLSRMLAAGALGHIGTNAGAEAVAALLAALTDRDSRVRITAAGALVRVAPHNTNQLPVLIHCLTNQPQTDGYFASLASLHQSSAIESLGQMGPSATPALPALQVLLEDSKLKPQVKKTILAIDPTGITLAFRPVIERVLPDFEASEPPQVLRLLTGEVVPVRVEHFKENNRAAIRDWATTNRVLAFINLGGDTRALRCDGWRFGDLPETAWEQAQPADLEAALAVGTKVLERKQLEGTNTAFEIPANVHLPLNLAFETALGDRGLMQIVEISRQPRSIKIRYKLVRIQRGQ